MYTVSIFNFIYTSSLLSYEVDYIQYFSLFALSIITDMPTWRIEVKYEMEKCYVFWIFRLSLKTFMNHLSLVCILLRSQPDATLKTICHRRRRRMRSKVQRRSQQQHAFDNNNKRERGERRKMKSFKKIEKQLPVWRWDEIDVVQLNNFKRLINEPDSDCQRISFFRVFALISFTYLSLLM